MPETHESRVSGRVGEFRSQKGYSKNSAKSATQCTKELNRSQRKSSLLTVDFLWKGIRIETQILALSFGKHGPPAPLRMGDNIQG
jgi:hypothetical protein